MDLETFEVRGKLPQWMRTALRDTKTGEVFVPDGVAGLTPEQATLAASFDGVPVASLHGHAYVPAEWAKRQPGAIVDVISRIVNATTECAATA